MTRLQLIPQNRVRHLLRCGGLKSARLVADDSRVTLNPSPPRRSHPSEFALHPAATPTQQMMPSLPACFASGLHVLDDLRDGPNVFFRRGCHSIILLHSHRRLRGRHGGFLNRGHRRRHRGVGRHLLRVDADLNRRQDETHGIADRRCGTAATRASGTRLRRSRDGCCRQRESGDEESFQVGYSILRDRDKRRTIQIPRYLAVFWYSFRHST